jgi:hypothetical protein
MANKDFLGASVSWEKASKMAPEEHYFVQQRALCIYKSEHPSKESSLASALEVISKIYTADETNDPETLWLVGAIYKRLYLCNNDPKTLKSAIAAYKRGGVVSNNYYTGENYAYCLNFLASKTSDSNEVIYCRYEAKKIREHIVSLLLKQLPMDSECQDKMDVCNTC